VVASFIAPWCYDRGGKAVGPYQARRAHYDSAGYGNHIEMGPMILTGLPKLRVLNQNPPVGSATPRANKVRDKATQRVASSWRYLGPHRGDSASSTFISESWLGGFLHALLVCWCQAIRVPHLRTGSVRMPHILLTTQTDLRAS
jgi:hypothetical protein